MKNEQTVLHVISRGNKGNNILLDDNDFNTYMRLLTEIKEEIEFDLYHNALMNNHIHLIMGVEDTLQMGSIMKYVNERYAKAFNLKRGLMDHVWRNRPRRFVIDNDSYMLTAGIYVDLNPVRAGLVQAAEDYPWSSAATYLTGKPNPLITLDPAYMALGDTDEKRRSAYSNLAKMWLGRQVDKKQAARFFRRSPTVMHPDFTERKSR
jgi:putative transposase